MLLSPKTTSFKFGYIPYSRYYIYENEILIPTSNLIFVSSKVSFTAYEAVLVIVRKFGPILLNKMIQMNLNLSWEQRSLKASQKIPEWKQ